MKNLIVAFLLTAFVGSGYIAKATSSYTVIVKEDEKDKKEKKSCDSKKSCCKSKTGDAKACAGMMKEGEAKVESPAGEASAAATPEKKACCKKKASCGEGKEKSDKGASL